MSTPPLNLAGVAVAHDESLIDPALAAHADAFFSATTGHDQKFDDELAAAAVAAAAAHQAEQQQQHQHHQLGEQPQQHDQQEEHHVGRHAGDEALAAFPHTLGGVGVDVGLGIQPLASPSQPGTHDDGSVASPKPAVHPSVNVAIAHVAPLTRPNRDDQTPHPEILDFQCRADFEQWFQGESSWCHFVQRRTTTPEKRAKERLRARIKAHEKMLSTMTPEQQATAPPLKRRHRKRTSAIKEKVTYTCHHAGRYEAKHSTTLPPEKLRLNTKKSVKCDCPARIVLTEHEEGPCKVSYFWRHEGHNAFDDHEQESGRLPKVIDEWLVAQIQAGKDTDDIRRALIKAEENKEEYLRQIAEDPSLIDPDKPPPLALTTRIKYPDIYNRYRKLKGPIKSFKPPKRPRIRKRQHPGDGGLKDASDTDLPDNEDVHAEAAGYPQGYSDQYPEANYPESAQPYQISQGDVVDGFAALRDAIDNNMTGDPFAHEGFERALLSLPRDAQNGNDELSDAVLRMASEQDKDRDWGNVSLDNV